ncbi:Pali-domain-containing protein [Mycena kentingensis (nom. inval.)]|nr:Pali-domain-containing protein [Mycena kentingensis (nom. inval.)]
MHFSLANGSTLNFGVLGYCTRYADGTTCTDPAVGYNIVDILTSLGLDLDLSSSTVSTLHTLTSTLILHPVAAGITGLACLISLGRLLRPTASDAVVPGIAILALLVSTAATAIDFAVFGQLKHYIENITTAQLVSLSATFGTSIWLTLAATIALFLAPCATCAGGRTQQAHRRNKAPSSEYAFRQTAV